MPVIIVVAVRMTASGPYRIREYTHARRPLFHAAAIVPHVSPSDHRQRSATPPQDLRGRRGRRGEPHPWQGPGRHSSPEQRAADARRGRRAAAFGGRIATGPVAVFRRWLTTPHDFDWIFVHRSTRPLHGLIKGVVVFGVGLNALVSMLMLGSPYGPSGTAEVTWVMIVFAAQISVIAWVIFAPTPTKKAQFLGLLLFGDLGITSVILLDTPTSALIGTFLFALNGALCTFFLSARILLAHLAFVNVVIAWIGVQAYLQGLWGVNDAVAAVLVASGSVSGVPVFAHIAWSLVSADARASEFDELTGVANRRGLQNAVDELWDVARSRGVPVAVLLVDIDRFKAVNDRYGHDRGDAVIKTVASRLHALLGSRGILARTGGEEFVGVVVDTDGDLPDLVNRVTATIHDPTDDVPVTASVGVAVMTPDSPSWQVGPAAVTRATRAADSMMYRAKAAGGDRVLTTRV